MAYDVVTPSGFSDLLSKIVDFCSTTMDWSANYDSEEEVATVTPKTDDAQFTLTLGFDEDMSPSGLHYIDVKAEKDGVTVQSNCNAMEGTDNAWFFAGETPEPWMHVVIKVSSGQYQHIYFGFIERYGDWSCGAVVTSNYWDDRISDRERWDDYDNSMLFCGKDGVDNKDENSGGIITEGSNAARVRAIFKEFDDHAVDDNSGIAFGGYTDNENINFIKPGLPLHSAEAVLTPVLILADMEMNGHPRPLGVPPGFRMVSMDGLDPEQLLVFGSQEYQVFPLSDKYRSTDYDDWPEYKDGGYDSAKRRFGASENMGVALPRS